MRSKSLVGDIDSNQLILFLELYMKKNHQPRRSGSRSGSRFRSGFRSGSGSRSGGSRGSGSRTSGGGGTSSFGTRYRSTRTGTYIYRPTGW